MFLNPGITGQMASLPPRRRFFSSTGYSQSAEFLAVFSGGNRKLSYWGFNPWPLVWPSSTIASRLNVVSHSINWRRPVVIATMCRNAIFSDVRELRTQNDHENWERILLWIFQSAAESKARRERLWRRNSSRNWGCAHMHHAVDFEKVV